MSSIRTMRMSDLLRLTTTNLDPFTETYNIGFYLEYLTKWPDLCRVIEGVDGEIEGYTCPPPAVTVNTHPPVLGKLESSPFPPQVHPYSPHTNPDPNYLPWHGHITALTVAPRARRLGHATALSDSLAKACDAADAWFVDLFVRESNVVAKELYRKMGYSVYRKVKDYYNDGEDALDMRMPLSKDKDRAHVRENGESFEVLPQDVW
ncbi:acyl-CoA N-acyltransferase [Karstenula rhodostoma CBS 690.94]|uniref:Acyl-CoA N-acyltransferase n=1 Tax=Karstenula rhodostoma CBS 690.94 TaxID=1392251 RepID=A0A9P4PBA8_9PLEO|nr:acyl-CoA N-acyltransferase [Karstenula rhodostoma CBS 690.94]